MVKLRIVCPWGSSGGGVTKSRPVAPPLRRQSSMNPQDEAVTMMSRRRMDDVDNSADGSKYQLRTDQRASQRTTDGLLVVMEEEDMEAMTMEKQHAEADMTVQQRASHTYTETPVVEEDDDGFADGLNSIGLAMQEQPIQRTAPAAITDGNKPSAANVVDENPIVKQLANVQQDDSIVGDEMIDEPPQPSAEDEEEEDDDDLLTASTSKPTSMEDSLSSAVPSSEWRRIHTCKYGRSEKSPTLAYGTWIWRHKKGAALHDDYVKTPTDSKLKHLKAAVGMLSDKVLDVKSVTSAASEAGYTLCKIDLETSIVVAWQPRVKGDALFFTRHVTTSPDAINALILEVPHALYDHTLHQGLHVFSETKAKALILSESHRCSRSLTNKCTGNDGEAIRNLCTTSTSKAASVYHNSDVAHAVQTTFHAIHEQLAEDNPRALFASLHATKSDDFVVSDGTSNAVQASSAIMLFSQQLAKNLPAAQVNLCNEFTAFGGALENLVGVSEDKRHICGATNVQGRHMNGAADPCRAKVRRNGQELTSSGKFLHIEQPVQLVMPLDAKSTKPAMSKPLSEALLVALQGI